MSKKKASCQSLLFYLFFLTIISSCTIQKRLYTNGYYQRLLINNSNTNSMKVKNTKSINTIPSKKERIVNDTITNIINTNVDSIENNKINIKDNNIKNQIPNISTKTKSNDKLTSGVKINNDTMQANNKLKNIKKMDNTQNANNNSKRNIAKIIGIALLLMAVIAAISAPITSGMFVSGNASLTALNVASSYSKYIGSIIGWIGIFMLDLLVSIGIYKYYKKEKPKLAKITSILRLIYSAFLGAAIIQLLKVTLTNPAITLYNYLNMFNTFWGWGLIAFGFHLIALGVLFENEGGKKWINIAIRALLIIAGLGYIILYVGMMIVPNPMSYTNMIKPIFLIPFIFGEVLYALWMLIKGGKLKNKKE